LSIGCVALVPSSSSSLGAVLLTDTADGRTDAGLACLWIGMLLRLGFCVPFGVCVGRVGVAAWGGIRLLLGVGWPALGC
jgi:hypothetical protein